MLKLGANERKFTGQALLLNFILPNFYFHCTTAYDLLRHCGIELGKRDFMSQPVNLVGDISRIGCKPPRKARRFDATLSRDDG